MKKTDKFTSEIKILVGMIVIALFVKWQIATGIVLGCIFASLYGKILERRFSALLSNHADSKVVTIVGTIISFMLLAMPILIAFLLPEIFNFLGVFIGLIYRKYFIYLEAFRKKG